MTTRRLKAVHAAVAGFAIFISATLIAAAATPGYHPAKENISALASLQAPHPWIMLIGFAGLSASAAAAGFALRGRLAGRSGTVAWACLLVVAAGIACAGAAREDCSTALEACKALETSGAVSGHHVLHELVSGVSFLLLVVVAFLLARALRATPGAARLATPARVAGATCATLLVVIVAGLAGPAGGVAEWAFVTLAFGLPLTVAALLERHAGAHPGARALAGPR